MKGFENAATIWFIAGFVCFMLEFVLPGFILFFFGVGAWIVAFLSLFMELSLNAQIILFLGASLITLLVFRKWLRSLLDARKQKSEIEDEFIGKTGIALTLIAPNTQGKLNFKGTTWDAISEDIIQPGERAMIIGNESILLRVKATKS